MSRDNKPLDVYSKAKANRAVRAIKMCNTMIAAIKAATKNLMSQ